MYKERLQIESFVTNRFIGYCINEWLNIVIVFMLLYTFFMGEGRDFRSSGFPIKTFGNDKKREEKEREERKWERNDRKTPRPPRRTPLYERGIFWMARFLVFVGLSTYFVRV